MAKEAKTGAIPIEIPQDKPEEFCQRNHIKKLSLFGSVLRDDFTEDSDIDVLVEFEEGHTPGLIKLAGMEIELSDVFGGRKVELNTVGTLSKYFVDEVLAEAQVLYDQVRPINHVEADA